METDKEGFCPTGKGQWSGGRIVLRLRIGAKKGVAKICGVAVGDRE